MFRCNLCLENLCSCEKYVQHMQNKHGYTDFHVYPCGRSDCKKSISTVMRLFEHEKEKHTHFYDVEKNYTTDASKIKPVLNMELKDILKNEASDVLASFYGKTALPRSVVNDVIKEITKLLSGEAFKKAFDKILNLILTFLPSEYLEIKELLNILQKPFDNISSELEIIKDNSKNYVAPKSVTIAEKHTFKKVNKKKKRTFQVSKKKIVLINKPITAQYISVSAVLKNFLEKPGVFEKVKQFLSDIKTSDNNRIRHLMQGSLWKSIEIAFPNQTVLPLTAYYDDVNVGNALGPHKKNSKLGLLVHYS